MSRSGYIAVFVAGETDVDVAGVECNKQKLMYKFTGSDCLVSGFRSGTVRKAPTVIINGFGIRRFCAGGRYAIGIGKCAC